MNETRTKPVSEGYHVGFGAAQQVGYFMGQRVGRYAAEDGCEVPNLVEDALEKWGMRMLEETMETVLANRALRKPTGVKKAEQMVNGTGGQPLDKTMLDDYRAGWGDGHQAGYLIGRRVERYAADDGCEVPKSVRKAWRKWELRMLMEAAMESLHSLTHQEEK